VPVVDRFGVKRAKREFKWPCDVCAKSTQKGWLWLGGGDWVKCPQCLGTGVISGEMSTWEPTRRIILPTAEGVSHG
jgi:hypothetical protein